MIIKSNNVFTSAPGEVGPQPLAIAVKDDRICWVGSPDSIPGKCRADGEHAEDFGDALIVPGFHDAHMHFFHSALYNSPLATRIVGKSEEDAVGQLGTLAQMRPAGTWLLSQGWREYLWNPPRHPSRASLDRIYPDRPVAMCSGDAHTLWLNSCALDVLGIDSETKPPIGGSYEKDADGSLTGIVRETAAMELMPRIAAAFSENELLRAYKSYIENLNSLGITSICDLSLTANPGLDFVRDDLFSKLESSGDLTVRVHMFPTLLEDTSRFSEMRRAYRSPMLQAQGLKQFFDGVSSQHTAWLSRPYANASFEGDCGRPTIAPEKMSELVGFAASVAAPVRIHAIGDEAIHQALDIFERYPSDAGNCLEHLENFQPGDMERLAAQGIIASVQPRHMTLDPGGPERDLGNERVKLMWPFRSMLDSGALLAFGTDSPVTDASPFATLYTAVTRRDACTSEPRGGWRPEERITLAEAVRAYTYGSAAAAQRSNELGQIAPGMLADIAVIDRDLFKDAECSPQDMLDARVIATFSAGKCVWRA